MAFDPNPKMSGYKFAFTGTNCSGKTTMAMAIAARLKAQNHILAELVSSQDRKITWKDDYFPFTPVAHYGMITNLIHAEVQAMLKGDADVIVTDRSVLDLYAIMCTDHPDHPMTRGLEDTVLSWLSTYTKIFYLAPLPYQEDGKRPADDFRMKTHAVLRDLMATYNLPNVVEIDRTDVYKEIGTIIGFLEPKPIFAETEKWQAIADTMKVSIGVKKPTCDVTSDIDVWVGIDDLKSVSTMVNSVKKLAHYYFGIVVHARMEFLLIPTNAFRAFKNDVVIYTPKEH